MAGKKFSAVLTSAGAARLAAAALSGVPVGFSEMAVGDGGGVLPVPDPQQTGLINELYRAPLNRLTEADTAANVIEAELIMPPQVGGFWMRELALFDDAGVCLAVANMPESYKPLLAQGAGRYQAIRIWLAVSSTSDVTLTDNPAVVLATVESVNKAKSEAQDYTDGIASELDNTIKTAIAEAVEAARRAHWETDNPVGDVRLFTQNIDPNKRWPWSTWKYLGEDKTLRLGKQDGSDTMTTGGSDSITLDRASLPKVQIDITGETDQHDTGQLKTSPTDLGTKTTGKSGKHNHKGGWGAAGAKWGSRSSGTDNQGDHDLDYTSEDGEHDHQLVLGQHDHPIPAIKHKHGVSGKTANLGEGKTISTVNSYIRLMAWYRAA